MNKTKKVFISVSTLLMAIVLSRFAISKLAAWEISVNAFIEMAKPINIDPTFFRVFTGILLAIVVLLYFTTSILTIFKNKISLPTRLNYYNIAFISNLFGLLMMVGALLSEFFLRIQPKWPLVYIAIGVIFLSFINILIVKKKISLYSKNK